MFPMAMKTNFRIYLKSFRALLGPWPIYPLPTTFVFAVASQFAASNEFANKDAVLAKIWIQEIPSTFFYGVVCYLTLILVKRLYERSKSQRSGLTRYLVSLSIAGFAFETIHQIFVSSSSRQFAALTIRNIVSLIVISAVFGTFSKKLQSEITEKSEALALLEEQRELVMEADEKARREVANFLHDNVQANLVVLAIELRKIAAVVDPPHNQEINSVIEEIDDLRALDVRLASRKLSPDISTIGLAATLEELFLEYRNAISISLEIKTLSIPNETALGVYRIIEQAILNAALHGQASKCSVQVIQGSNNDLVLTVTNNGLPIPEVRASGTGSAVIESWVQKFHGRWTLESANGETALTATLQIGS